MLTGVIHAVVGRIMTPKDVTRGEESERCNFADFEGGGRRHTPSFRGWPLEAGKDRKINSPFDSAERDTAQ